MIDLSINATKQGRGALTVWRPKGGLQHHGTIRDTYINRDVARLFPKLNRHAYRRFVTMLCKLSGTITNKSQVGRAVEASESTIRGDGY